MKITKAGSADISNLVTLLNSAYRGEQSNKGWTTEAHLIGGEIRTDAASIQEVLNKADSVILKCEDEENRIVGTVNLQKHEHKLYLGMFAVSPLMQGAGIGKLLLKEAEKQAVEFGCRCIYMTVISVRTELINWYKWHGYVDTNARIPFPEDELTGKHQQMLEFAVLEKAV